jgi:hypothetical protein
MLRTLISTNKRYTYTHTGTRTENERYSEKEEKKRRKHTITASNDMKQRDSRSKPGYKYYHRQVGHSTTSCEFAHDQQESQTPFLFLPETHLLSLDRRIDSSIQRRKKSTAVFPSIRISPYQFVHCSGSCTTFLYPHKSTHLSTTFL